MTSTTSVRPVEQPITQDVAAAAATEPRPPKSKATPKWRGLVVGFLAGAALAGVGVGLYAESMLQDWSERAQEIAAERDAALELRVKDQEKLERAWARADAASFQRDLARAELEELKLNAG